jgi:hypothetical protein
MIVPITSDEDCSFGSSLFVGDTLDRSRCTTEAASLMPVGEYVASLKALKVDSHKVVVLGAFAPPGAPACADVRPSARLDALVAGFPNRGQAISICEPDFGELVDYPVLLKSTVGLPCFYEPLLDVDPATDGLQVDCAAWYTYRDGDALVEELLPYCAGDAPGPCWHIVQSQQFCPGAGQQVQFRDERLFGVDTEARVTIECVSR